MLWFEGTCRRPCGAAWSCGLGASPAPWRKPSIGGCWRRPGSRRSVWSRRESTSSRTGSTPLCWRGRSGAGSREPSCGRGGRGSAPAGPTVLLGHTWISNPSSSRRWPVRLTPVLPLRIAFLFVVPFVPLVAQQTGTVSGTVAATESGAPLVGASVAVVRTARSVLTNEKGQYHLNVPAGAHSVRPRPLGYEAAEERVGVPAGQTVAAAFKGPAPPPPPPPTS